MANREAAIISWLALHNRHVCPACRRIWSCGGRAAGCDVRLVNSRCPDCRAKDQRRIADLRLGAESAQTRGSGGD